MFDLGSLAPKPLDEKKKKRIARHSRVFFFLLGAILTAGGAMAAAETLDLGTGLATAAGLLLVAVALRASDATVLTLTRWLPP